MIDAPAPDASNAALAFIAAGGEMGARMRTHDWTTAPLGSPAGWSQSLRTVVGIMLSAKQPMFVAWGPERLLLYNDGYAPMLGDRHPSALGRPFFEVWSEVRHELSPLFEQVFAGQPVHMDDIKLFLDRPGRPREAHFAFSYTPVRDESGDIVALFCPCNETTEQVTTERRRGALLTLDDRMGDVTNTADLSFVASEILGEAMGASRVGYGVMNAVEGTITVERNWSSPGFESVAGVHRFSDYGAYIDDLRRGEPVANADVETDPRTADRIEAFRSIGIRACLDVPVVEQGQAVAEMFVHSAAPRIWTEEDVAFVRDVGERTQAAIARRMAEQELRASEARLRAVINATPVGLVFANADGRITGANARAEEITGHPVLRSPSVDDYREWVSFHPDGRQVEGREYPLARVLAGDEERPELEVLYRRGDGRDAWVRFVASPVRDPGGRVVAGVVAFLDIDRERRTEARLRELNADLERQVIERTQARGRSWAVSPDLMGALNPKGYFETSNPAWETILGWSEEEVRRTPIWDLLHPDDLMSTRDSFTLTQSGHPAIQFPNRYQGKDGSYRWLSWVVVPEDGMLYCTGRDITAEKAHEAELETAREALRQAQKMDAVGQLTGGIAHDFNNMLAVVIGSLDLLGRRLGTADARATRYVEAARDGARRAALLTQRLLAFSRQQPLRSEPIDVNKLVTGMSELIRGSLGSAIQLETVLAGGGWRAHADPNQLENVLLNLAVNARDAMPDGGKLTIETQNSHLDARYAAAQIGVPAGQYVLIAVTDTGSGMPDEVIARAFDPFFTTKEVGKGTGLGLSQVYGFVKQSGGHVKIYSEPGQGTTVKVYLPRLVGETIEVFEGRRSPDIPRGELQEVILVVEDEPAVRQFSIEALTELGYRVLEADGAASALRLLETHSDIALMFTDVVMPEVNGRKLADAARQRRPDLKVLFTTGYTRNAVVHNGILDPGVELIGKPFTVEELAAKVRGVLDAPVAAGAGQGS